jgi:hypothetical protein
MTPLPNQDKVTVTVAAAPVAAGDQPNALTFAKSTWVPGSVVSW